jgi:hypothetical protein
VQLINKYIIPHYTAYNGNSLPTLRDKLSGPILDYSTPEYETDTLSRNVGTELALYAA